MKRRTIKELEAENSELRRELSRLCTIIESARQILAVSLVDPGMADRIVQRMGSNPADQKARGVAALIPTRKTRCFGGVPCGPGESCSGCES